MWTNGKWEFLQSTPYRIAESSDGPSLSARALLRVKFNFV